MPHGIHKLKQTAFRLPEELLAWLKRQSEREQRARTAIVADALSDYRAKHDPDTTTPKEQQS